MSNQTTELRLLTIDEVAALLRVSRRTAWVRVHTEGFPEPLEVGQKYRWVQSEVEEWLLTRRVTVRRLRPRLTPSQAQLPLDDGFTEVAS